MSWQFFLSISIITEVAGRLMQRALMKNDKSDPIAYAIVFQFFAGIFILIFALFHGIKGPTTWSIWPNLLAMPVLWVIANILIFRSLKNTEASIFTILFSSRVIWIILASLFFLHESFTFVQMAGTVLIIVAIILVSYHKQKIKIAKGEKLVLLAAIVFGLSVVNDAYVVRSFDVATYMALAFFAPAFGIWIVFPKATTQIKQIIRSNIFKKILLLSIVYGTDSIAYLYAYRSGNNYAQMASVFQITTILTVLASILILKEKSHIVMKIIAGIVSFIGVLLVAK